MLALATWNVKDLFEGATLEAKLGVVERMLVEMSADVVALQEIGNERALARVAAAAGYGRPLFATPDARGIRNAALVREGAGIAIVGSRVHTAEHLAFPAFAPEDPSPFGTRIPLRRGVLHVELDAHELGDRFHLFVVHFKSGRPVPRPGPACGRARAEGELLALVWRSAEALHVRGLVDDVLARDPAANVVVAGDFNDGPASVVVRVVSDTGALASAGDRVPLDARYSILVEGERRQIDHLLLSPSLAARVHSARFLNERLLDHTAFAGDAAAAARPDSDHAPLLVLLD